MNKKYILKVGKDDNKRTKLERSTYRKLNAMKIGEPRAEYATLTFERELDHALNEALSLVEEE